MTEALVLESNVKHFIKDRQQRLERLNNRIRKGRIRQQAAKSAEKKLKLNIAVIFVR
ncbi:hypothetical protein PT974_12595 [Cladobotryum mycophilum]|uniref:Uncharacterized protein n=1 Tax=Cladobotryum mycophilum TaxID=491253 RepID=A0ABR0S8F3_9HYPO